MIAVERILDLVDDSNEKVVSNKLFAFRALLLLHTAIQSWHYAYLFSTRVPAMWAETVLVASYLSICFVVSLSPRLARFMPLAALPALLYQLAWFFPGTTNHFYLSLWSMAIMAALGALFSDDSEGRMLQLQALQWSVVIVLFYTGFNKLIYGTYIFGDFLAYKVGVVDSFAEIFQFTMPADELARLRAIDPGQPGAGPYRTSAPFFLLLSNSTYLLEMSVPFALLNRRSRPVAVVILIAFVVSLQLAAREPLFCLLMLNHLLLFTAQVAWGRRLLWPIVFLYVWLLLASLGLLPGSSLLIGAHVPGKLHL